TAASTAPQVSVPVTGTATSGNLSATNSINLVDHTPSFGLIAVPTSLGINQGASGTTNVTVIPQYGFTGNVSLAASGLPAGVTATFSPASTSSNSTLTLAVGSSAVPGTSTITITGTSG